MIRSVLYFVGIYACVGCNYNLSKRESILIRDKDTTVVSVLFDAKSQPIDTSIFSYSVRFPLINKSINSDSLHQIDENYWNQNLLNIPTLGLDSLYESQFSLDEGKRYFSICRSRLEDKSLFFIGTNFFNTKSITEVNVLIADSNFKPYFRFKLPHVLDLHDYHDWKLAEQTTKSDSIEFLFVASGYKDHTDSAFIQVAINPKKKQANLFQYIHVTYLED